MKIKRNILLILFVIFSNMTNNILSQDLSKLSESERNKKLIEIAKAVYQAPRLRNFYREYGNPIITEMRTKTLPAEDRKKIAENSKDIWYGSSNNQKFYIVYFQYDMNKERFDEGYAAKVYIWENTGSAFAIGLGNMTMLPVRNGKVSDHDKAATPVKYYTITYSKDVPNATSLPKTAKYGDIVTISLKTIISVAYDGWTREDGYNFDPKSDLTNGIILSDLTKSLQNQSYERIVQIKVTGDMKVNVSRYQEEYEAPY